MTSRQTKKLKALFAWIVLAIIMGQIYTFFVDGYDEIFPIINSLVISFLIGGSFAVFELYVFPGTIRKYNFLSILFIRSGFYIAVIFIIIFFETLLARMISNNYSFIQTLQSEEYRHYLFHEDFFTGAMYAFLLIVIFNFTRQMNKKMGQGTMLSYVSGKYAKPVMKERIFMFLRILEPTRIAEQIGLMKFHNLLNDIIFDITKSILANKGMIYEYVDDEVVIVWRTKTGFYNASCIRTFFDARDTIEEEKEKYFTKYGLIPHLQAALHCGPVVMGEIGDVKTEIVYNGDVMNTTARILDKCHEIGKDLLMSADVIYRMQLPVIYKPESCGWMHLKGKEHEIEVFSIKEPDFSYT